MSQSLSKREQIRRKNIVRRRKNWATFGLISIAVIGVFILVIGLPKWIMSAKKPTESNGFEVGEVNAPLTVEIFSSFSCSHCKDFSDNEEKAFIDAYVNTGQVLYRYFNLPSLNEQSILASIASYCAADQNRFFDYKELLYTYAFVQDGFSKDNLIKYAGYTSMDKEKFASCLSSDTYAEAYQYDREYASSAGIRYTPSFLINGQIYTTSELNQVVESLLGN